MTAGWPEGHRGTNIWAELCWAGLGWAGLNCVGLSWAGQGLAGAYHSLKPRGARQDRGRRPGSIAWTAGRGLCGTPRSAGRGQVSLAAALGRAGPSLLFAWVPPLWASPARYLHGFRPLWGKHGEQ